MWLMTLRGRIALSTLCGLVLAAGVHIVVVLGSPAFARKDAYHRLSAATPEDHAIVVATPGGGSTWLPRPDPATAVAACPFDLNAGPVRISAKPGALFESLSLHARGGSVFFAVTDRAAVRGELELVVLTQRQLDEALAAEDENDPSHDVRIVAPRREGFVVVRVLAPFPSQRPEARDAAEAVSCTVDEEE
jgi:uncharacterized membrane protein